jgi:Tfp pilus assembly protein FimT
MKAQVATEKARVGRSESGRSLIEMLAVVAIASILTAVAVPQVISARRLIRSTALPREVASHLRYARQQAMSQRQAVTFQYDDATKEVTIYDHNNVNNATVSCNMTGTAILGASGFPATACSTTLLSVPLAGSGGLPTSEVSYGVPTGISVTTLSDNTPPTALTSSKVYITFQPDGSVIDAAGAPLPRAMFFYNNLVPTQTASAVSVLGVSGRVRVWRYDTNASSYAE